MAYNAPNVTAAFQYLYENHRYTDFTFISQDRQDFYYVHKLVVSLFSAELSRIVKNCDSFHVDIVSNRALQNMVKFFYSLDPVFESIHDVKNTKIIADRFEINELAKICREKFSSLPVTKEDVLVSLETSREFKDEAKERECIKVIGGNRDTVLASQQFMNLQYEKAVSILEQLKHMHMITDSLFLHYAIKWLYRNNKVNEKKSDVIEKVDLSKMSLNEFLNLVVSFPTFFSNVEISNTVEKVRHKQIKSEIPSNRTANAGTRVTNSKTFAEAAAKDLKKFHDVGIGTEKVVQVTKAVGTCSETKEAAINTDVQENLPAVQNSSASDEMDKKPEKRKKITIQILNEEDGVNVFKYPKRVKFTIEDEIATRSVQVSLDEVLKKGLLGTEVLERKQFHQEYDVNVSYEGIFNLIRMLKDDDDLTPRELIEVLNAAVYLQLSDVEHACIVKISKIVDTDPLFLDGLRNFTGFEDQCLSILLHNPLNIILHPNFIRCDAGLILLILQQRELNIKSETQLLLVVISWLEAAIEDRKKFRSIFLKNLAFENISTEDFNYAVSCYPNFFDQKEVEVIVAYRNAVGAKKREYRDKLPSWYNPNKSRKVD